MAEKTKHEGFTAEEKAAMKERAKELKASASHEEALKDKLAKIEELPDGDRELATREHEIDMKAEPTLRPRTWYGMPGDANKDGKIEAAELKAARAELVQHRVDSIMKDLDRNQDGKISRDEARGQISRRFAELDANQDGFISRDELLKAVSARPAAPK